MVLGLKLKLGYTKDMKANAINQQLFEQCQGMYKDLANIYGQLWEREEFNELLAEPKWDEIKNNTGRLLKLSGQLVELNSGKAKELLAFSLKHDLTNMQNKRAFKQRMKQYESPEAVKKDSWVCLSIDIKGLKIVNTKAGHAQGGDALLLTAAEAIVRSNIRTDDAFHLSGDEFMVILKECSYEDAQNKVEQIKIKLCNLWDEKYSEITGVYSKDVGLHSGVANPNCPEVQQFYERAVEKELKKKQNLSEREKATLLVNATMTVADNRLEEKKAQDKKSSVAHSDLAWEAMEGAIKRRNVSDIDDIYSRYFAKMEKIDQQDRVSKLRRAEEAKYTLGEEPEYIGQERRQTKLSEFAVKHPNSAYAIAERINIAKNSEGNGIKQKGE